MRGGRDEYWRPDQVRPDCSVELDAPGNIIVILPVFLTGILPVDTTVRSPPAVALLLPTKVQLRKRPSKPDEGTLAPPPVPVATLPVKRQSAMTSQSSVIVRAAAFLSRALSLENAISIGLKSGE